MIIRKSLLRNGLIPITNRCIIYWRRIQKICYIDWCLLLSSISLKAYSNESLYYWLDIKQRNILIMVFIHLFFHLFVKRWWPCQYHRIAKPTRCLLRARMILPAIPSFWCLHWVRRLRRYENIINVMCRCLSGAICPLPANRSDNSMR